MDLKFQCLSTAVSLMSEEDFQKVLAIRQRQLEKTRIFEYVAGSENMQLKSAADKIKVISAPEPQEWDWIESAWKNAEGPFHYFCTREYAVLPEEFPLTISSLRYEYKSGPDKGIQFQIAMKYKKSSADSVIVHVFNRPYRGQEESDRGLKNLLRELATDLGIGPEERDKDLLALLELLFGETVAHKWHLINPKYLPAYTFAKVVIEGETRIELF
jgi:hypothetical protein